mmetsp:Transcript_11670/g.16540  ORF Transcript_11670/g.16540 Transcript_11670/m.16540 type:complete len:120 (-) Transcript_11670:311-670(-)
MQEEGKGELEVWIKDGDLKHTLDKAESRIKFEAAATAMLRPRPINTYPNSYKNALQNGRSPAPSSGKGSGTSTDPVKIITKELKECTTQQARINKIFFWRSKDKDACILCPDAKSHKFL